jgi:hypothetical protein
METTMNYQFSITIKQEPKGRWDEPRTIFNSIKSFAASTIEQAYDLAQGYAETKCKRHQFFEIDEA